MNKQLVERMYWEHGYTVEDIEQRLRLSRPEIQAVIESSKWHEEWDEDKSVYRREHRARTQAKRPELVLGEGPLTLSRDDMIRQQLDRLAQVN